MKQALLFIFLIVQLTSYGQVKQKIADQLFQRMEYNECVGMFDELAKQAIKGKKSASIENVRKAAVANFKLYRMKPSIAYWEFLANKNTLQEEDAVMHIQASRFIGNYSEAEQLITRYETQFPTNTFLKKMQFEAKDFASLFADSASTKIKKTAINSFYGDFSPTFYQNGIVYATKSVNAEVINGRYKWDNSYYVSLMQTSYGKDATVGNGKLLRHEFLDKAHDGPVAFSKDEQKMVITKNKFGKKKGKDIVVLALYFSEMKDGKWSKLVPFEYNDDAYNVGHGCFSEDGRTLYFVSDMPGGLGQTDIYRSKWENGKWTKPENLGPKINTSQQEMFPFVLKDKLFFASNGHFGLGGLDLFETNLSQPEKPTNLGYPINCSADDFAMIVDSTGLKGYFSTNREDVIDKIYAFEREDIQIELVVSIYEKYEQKEPVAQQPFWLINQKTGQKDEYFTNHEGKLALRIRKNEHYTLTTEKTDFKLLKEEQISTKGITKNTQLTSELILLPTKITIALRVTAKDTKQPLAEAKTNVSHLSLKWDTTLVTNEHGLATLVVDRNKDYWASASKKGYIDAEKGFSTSNQDGKIIELELELTPIKKGEKFKLENIFYDLNKATLRPESMSALDRLAEFIIKNDLKIELSAHTDSRGSAVYNQKLSQARAQSCVDYLLTKGVKPKQINAKGYGESQLVNHCKDGVTCSEELHQENRRTEVKILDF
jgi:outer membrane protein OmpA-like peptidoglycan-associated protein